MCKQALDCAALLHVQFAQEKWLLLCGCMKLNKAAESNATKQVEPKDLTLQI